MLSEKTLKRREKRTSASERTSQPASQPSECVLCYASYTWYINRCRKHRHKGASISTGASFRLSETTTACYGYVGFVWLSSVRLALIGVDLAWVENFETEKNISKAMKRNALPLAKGLKRILLSIKADRCGVHLRFVWVYFLSFNFHLRLPSLVGSSCVFPFPSICSIVCSNERSLFVKQSKFYLSGHLLKTRWRFWLLFFGDFLSLSFFLPVDFLLDLRLWFRFVVFHFHFPSLKFESRQSIALIDIVYVRGGARFNIMLCNLWIWWQKLTNRNW